MVDTEFDGEPLYEPLHTIRLLRLPWGQDPSKFDGYLVSFALNSASCPDFIALSYTWGPSSHSHPINLNGHKVDVLDNLYSFLKLVPELPEFGAETWWWIDSICINQNDEKEKASQMEIMGIIYHRAYKTIVWLGEEVSERFSEESRDCTGAIENLYRICRETDNFTFDNDLLLKDKLLSLREPGSGIDWKAVERLLLRPWWRRVWTLQEFLISNYLRFYCGKKSISRRRLQHAIYIIWRCGGWNGSLMSQKAFHGAWNRRRMNQWYEMRRNEMGLVAMMAYVGDCGATDERDRIYSLLGLANDSDMIGPLNSNSTVEVAYTKLVASFIAKYNSLDIICYCHLFNNPGNKSTANKLPSWVPDWRAHVEGKVIPVMASQGSQAGTGNFRPKWVLESNAQYKASGNRLPQFTISSDLQTLTCSGIVIDTIDGLGGSTYNDTKKAETEQEKAKLLLVQSSSDVNRHSDYATSCLSEVMEIFSRCMVLDRDDRYLASYTTSTGYQAEFENLCSTMVTNPDIVPVWFRDWFSLNANLLIRGRALEDHGRALIPSKPSPTWEDFRNPKRSLRRAYGRFDDTVITMARRLAVTKRGYLGMAACRARKGDRVCVLFGCSIPVLLREKEVGKYEFIGECYVDRFMNGEALDKDSSLLETKFVLI